MRPIRMISSIGPRSSFVLGSLSTILCFWPPWKSEGPAIAVALHQTAVHRPPRPGAYDAIVVPAGGQHKEGGPPAHVALRLIRAAELYNASGKPKPWVITTAWGTPHKPCPHDVAGFERHESADNAVFLLQRGVPASHLLEESISLETVGNAYFTRILHTEVRGLRHLAIVNNRWHMPRTRAVFLHVFGVPAKEHGTDPGYWLDFIEVDDGLQPDVLNARLIKEAVTLPKFQPGGQWQNATRSLQDLHQWLHQENTAYAAKRLLEERKPLDPALLKSY